MSTLHIQTGQSDSTVRQFRYRSDRSSSRRNRTFVRGTLASRSTASRSDRLELSRYSQQRVSHFGLEQELGELEPQHALPALATDFPQVHEPLMQDESSLEQLAEPEVFPAGVPDVPPLVLLPLDGAGSVLSLLHAKSGRKRRERTLIDFIMIAFRTGAHRVPSAHHAAWSARGRQVDSPTKRRKKQRFTVVRRRRVCA
jgi:hypothetical protein